MPLSEEELRLLEQMEQALAQEDPKFVSTLRGSSLERVARMRTMVAGGVFVLGVALMMSGAIAAQIWLGVLGFVVMLGSATVGLAAWRGRHAPAQAKRPEESILDVDERPQRFGVVQGGRADKPRRVRKPRAGRKSGPKAPKHGTFMQRMEERWEQRRRRGF